MLLVSVEGYLFAVTPVSPWLYRAYQTDDGLPDISITSVAQTDDGYLWVATKGGLVSFNGQRFAVVPRTNFPELPSRTVRAMIRDRHDQLWLAMERGPLLCLKPDGLQIFTAKDGLPDQSQRVVAMAEDREGAIWVAYPNQLRRVRNGQVESIVLPADWSTSGDILVTSDGQGNIWCARGGGDVGVWREGGWHSISRLPVPVTALSSGSRSNVWIGTGEGVFRIEAGHDAVQVASLSAATAPTALLEDGAGALWVGTSSEGLFRWQDQKFERVPTSQQQITCLFEDREGNILAGTAGGGLNLIRPRAVALIGREAELPFESVRSVTEDTEGYLWAVAQDGRLARAQDGRWELMSSATNWPGGKATCVAADRKGGVWVGTGDQGLKFFRDGTWRGWSQRDGLLGEGVRSLLVASNGDVWAGILFPYKLQRLRAGQIQTITNITRLGPIRALAEGPDGTIWVGTSEGAIRKVRGLTLVEDPSITESEPLSVRSLLATPDGSLWIGYAGDGLGHLRNGEYRRLTTDAGLPDDFISQLLTDGSGNLWITGNRGLARVSFSELALVIGGQAQRVSMRTYGSADGLPGVQPNRDYCPSAWSGHDGRLWFSMHSGLLVVDTKRIGDNPHPPVLQLERVRLDDELVACYNAGSPLQTQLSSNLVNLRGLTAPLPVGPDHRKLEIDFAALSFTSPENVQFRYQLGGFDEDWVEAGSHHTATYPHLPAGDYKFQVLACNNAGVWNETGATLVFLVSPFFWETWWFKVGGGLSTVLLAGGIAFLISRRRYHRKIRRLEARRALEQERARIAKDIHDDLGASLTRITLLSQPSRGKPEDPEVAAESLMQIHQTARSLTHAMGEVVWAVNPEHDTFDSLANYISNYAQSFLRAAGIRCRIEMPVELPQQELSSGLRHNLLLAFKEALSNVAKHARASEVRISLTAGTTGLELVIADNGSGFFLTDDRAEGLARAVPGNGLANMRSRLQESGGDCRVESHPGAGTKITFRLPLKPQYEQR